MADNPELQVRDRGPGAALAAARTAQNLGVADVARQLKLSVSQVAALEAGEFERLPGPVFVRGFVRNYARLLKLDADRLLDLLSDTPGAELQNQQMPTARGIPFPTSTVRRWPRLLLLLLLLLVSGLASYEFHWRDGAGFSPPGEPLTAALAPNVSLPATEVPKAIANDASLQAEAKPTPAMQDPSPAAAEVLPAEPAAVAPPAEEGELRFTFSQDSWVHVQEASGRTVFTRLNPAGTEQRVTGKPPFTLVIGNAAGVRLSYNQQAIDIEPHIVKDGVARFTLK